MFKKISNVFYVILFAIPIMAAITFKTIGFSSDVIGPFKEFNEDVDINLYYTSGSNYSEVMEFMNLYLPNGEIVYSYKTAAHSIRAGIKNSFSPTLPLSSFFSNKGLIFEFKAIIYPSLEEITSSTATIYPCGLDNIDPFKLIDRKFISKPVAFSFAAGRSTEHTCKFDFTEFETSFRSKSYSYINVNDMGFSYVSSLPFQSGTCQLKFKDDKHLFPLMSSKTDGYIHLPIQLNENGTNITYSFKRKFYYDKNTMQISDIWRNGFENTDYFYLPLNHKEDLETYEFIFEFYDIGGSKAHIEYSLRYSTRTYLFGSCNNSDYCIVGGVVQ